MRWEAPLTPEGPARTMHGVPASSHHPAQQSKPADVGMLCRAFPTQAPTRQGAGMARQQNPKPARRHLARQSSVSGTSDHNHLPPVPPGPPPEPRPHWPPDPAFIALIAQILAIIGTLLTIAVTVHLMLRW
jgi:hypothetical protein